MQQPSAGCSAKAWTAAINLEAGPAGPKPPCCLTPGRRPYDDPSVGSLQLYAAVTGDLISYRLQHLFPAKIVHDHLPKTLQKLCGESRTRRSSLQFYDVLSLRFWVLELPERHEILLSPLSSQAPKLWSFKAFGDFSLIFFFLEEVQPDALYLRRLITKILIWYRYVRGL